MESELIEHMENNINALEKMSLNLRNDLFYKYKFETHYFDEFNKIVWKLNCLKNNINEIILFKNNKNE